MSTRSCWRPLDMAASDRATSTALAPLAERRRPPPVQAKWHGVTRPIATTTGCAGCEGRAIDMSYSDDPRGPGNNYGQYGAYGMPSHSDLSGLDPKPVNRRTGPGAGFVIMLLLALAVIGGIASAVNKAEVDSAKDNVRASAGGAVGRELGMYSRTRGLNRAEHICGVRRDGACGVQYEAHAKRQRSRPPPWAGARCLPRG